MATFMTEAEYLATEPKNPVRREYVDGFLYAQAEASLVHSRIASNLQRTFSNATRGGPCWTYAADMKVQIRGTDYLRYYYPDLVVVCEPHDNLQQAETRPCLIVEILSQSTRQADLTHKARDYLSLPSLQGYLVVDSEHRAAELYRRMPSGWTREVVQDSVMLPCVGVELGIGEIYEGVSMR
jgi:Uma2 family endonuclease